MPDTIFKRFRIRWLIIFALFVLAVLMVQNMQISRTNTKVTNFNILENVLEREPAIAPGTFSHKDQPVRASDNFSQGENRAMIWGNASQDKHAATVRDNISERQKSVTTTGDMPQRKQTTMVTDLVDLAPGNCSEQRHVAFIKVHKAASTTFTTILQRFGYSRDLTFALPRDGPFHIGLFDTFHPRRVLPIREGAEYEILCQHVVYNKEAFKEYLPSDTKVFAAVRHPVQHFMSSFLYFPEYFASTKKDLPPKSYSSLSLMEHFLTNPEFYEPKGFRKGSLAVGRQSFDLGIPTEQTQNSTYVKEYIQMLEKEMVLIAISEYFDESLIILKRKFCWSTKDIIYKVQHKGYRKKPKLPDNLVSRLREVQPADFAIYEYFLQKHKTMVSTEPRLKEEVTFLRSCLKKVQGFCQNGGKSPQNILEIEKSEFSEGFIFNKDDCTSLDLNEKKAVERLQRKQTPKE